MSSITRTISQCTVTLTRACNLRCRFCYAQDAGYQETDTLSLDDFKRVVDFCADGCVKYLVFTGGEPTLYPWLLDALHYVASHAPGMTPTMATNGIRLQDASFCRALVDGGLRYVDVSLKGIDCQADQMRAIRNLADLSVDFACSMVLTRQSVDRFCDEIKNACANGAKAISFTFEIDNIDSTTRDEEYLKDHNPNRLVESFVSRIDELNAIVRDWWVEYSLPYCAFTKRQLSLLKNRLARPCQVRCGNGVTFDTELNAIPCNMYFSERLGRLGRDFSSLTEYQQLVRRVMKCNGNFATVLNLPSTDCSTCRHFDACLGGCPVTWKNYSYRALREVVAAVGNLPQSKCVGAM